MTHPKGIPSFRDPSTTTKIILGITISTVTFLLACALVEDFLRLFIPSSNVSVFEYTTNTSRFKTMKTNIRGLVYGVPFETNNFGFRDNEPWSYDKVANEIRIAVQSYRMLRYFG